MPRNAFVFVLAADHEAGDVLQKHQRNLALAAELDEVRAFLRRLRKQHTVVGDDADRHAFNVRKAAHQRRAKTRLEFMELTAVDNARNHFMHVIRFAGVEWDHAIQLGRVIQRRHWRTQRLRHPLAAVQTGDGLPGQRQRVRIVLRQVVGHA